MAVLSFLQSLANHPVYGRVYEPVGDPVDDPIYDPIDDPVLDYLIEDSICSCTLMERKGFNGDMTGNFRGDEYSWRICLEKVCGDFYGW